MIDLSNVFNFNHIDAVTIHETGEVFYRLPEILRELGHINPSASSRRIVDKLRQCIAEHRSNSTGYRRGVEYRVRGQRKNATLVDSDGAFTIMTVGLDFHSQRIYYVNLAALYFVTLAVTLADKYKYQLACELAHQHEESSNGITA